MMKFIDLVSRIRDLIEIIIWIWNFFNNYLNRHPSHEFNLASSIRN